MAASEQARGFTQPVEYKSIIKTVSDNSMKAGQDLKDCGKLITMLRSRAVKARSVSVGDRVPIFYRFGKRNGNSQLLKLFSLLTKRQGC